jgi:hydrogenase maturation protease
VAAQKSPAGLPSGPLVVIGVGNLYRSDDGVGLIIARQVDEAAVPSVQVRAENGEGAALLDAWQGADVVILCDAVRSGAAPGTIHRLDAHRQPIPAGFFHYSTHAFSVAQAVELARVLGQLPPYLVLYGVEGANFNAGIGLSPPVAHAAQEVVRQVLAKARAHLAGVERYGVKCQVPTA